MQKVLILSLLILVFSVAAYSQSDCPYQTNVESLQKSEPGLEATKNTSRSENGRTKATETLDRGELTEKSEQDRELRILKESIKYQPDCFTCWLNLGRSLIQSGKLSEEIFLVR